MKNASEIIKILIVAISFSLIAISSPAFSATQRTVDMDVEVPQFLELYWSPTDPGDSVQLTGLNKITVNNFLDGYIDKVDGGMLIVSSNVYWDLNVVADNDYFTGGSGTKPSSDVYIDTDVKDTYPFRLLGTSPVTLYRGMAPGVSSHEIYYKIILNASDSAGTYSLNLTYTLTKN